MSLGALEATGFCFAEMRSLRVAVASKAKNDSNTEEAPVSNTSKDGYVGRQVQSFIDYQGREYRIEGEVVAEQRRRRGARRVMYLLNVLSNAWHKAKIPHFLIFI